MGNSDDGNCPDDCPRRRYGCYNNTDCDFLRKRCGIDKALTAGFGGAIAKYQPR